MKIKKIHVDNFRTLEDFTINFSESYSAICGKNDSGKSNVIKAMEILFGGYNEFYYFISPPKISLSSDFTKWVSLDTKKQYITILAVIEIDKTKDTGLFEFISTYLSLNNVSSLLTVELCLKITDDKSEEINIKIGDQLYTDLKATEVLKKIRSSRCFILHNSTEQEVPFRFRRGLSVMGRYFSPEYDSVMDTVKDLINEKMTDIAQAQQIEISQLLGRLQEKYAVRLGFSELSFNYIPVNITLGDKKYDIPLDGWGSGTQNRTAILITLFNAKQIGESETSADKVIPIIAIEEPESFLHPSAQAEFGRVLQDLSQEFDVQVIATTHSPYMLSLPKPESNILLDRKVIDESVQFTYQKNTSGENWMQPFAQILGINDDEFSPWKKLLFSTNTSILLVEGETDVQYMELLKDNQHGEHRLVFDGEIFAYGGAGNLKNNLLLKFIKNRYDNLFVTYDLDVESIVETQIKSLGFEEGRDYLGIGVDEDMKRNIEGLLPQEFKDKVYSQNPNLVQMLVSGDKEQVTSAKNRFKKILVEEFKKEAIPGDEKYFSEFYKLVKALNITLNEK